MAKKTPLMIMPGFPAQLGLLAQQMNQGFGGGLLAQRNYLDGIYSPITLPPEVPLGAEDSKKTDGTNGMTPAELSLYKARLKKWGR